MIKLTLHNRESSCSAIQLSLQTCFYQKCSWVETELNCSHPSLFRGFKSSYRLEWKLSLQVVWLKMWRGSSKLNFHELFRLSVQPNFFCLKQEKKCAIKRIICMSYLTACVIVNSCVVPLFKSGHDLAKSWKKPNPYISKCYVFSKYSQHLWLKWEGSKVLQGGWPCQVWKEVSSLFLSWPQVLYIFEILSANVT